MEQTTNKKKSKFKRKKKDPLKVCNIIERTIKRKKAKSYHITKVKKTNNRGRKDKLTPLMKSSILTAIRSGMRLNRACKLCGITTVTFSGWLETGRYEADRIRKELTEWKKELREKEEWPTDLEEQEDLTDWYIRKLRPNKFFNFLIEVEKYHAKGELDNLNSILNARDGGEYLAEVITEKTAKGKVKKVIEIKKYQKPNWKAAKWLLKVTNPDIYSDRQILAHEGEITNNTNVGHEHTIKIDESPDNIARVLGLLIETGFIKGKLIEHCESEPEVIDITNSKTD